MDCMVFIVTITDFINEHPGGKDILLQFIGTDASEFFNELHQPSILEDYAEDYKIGELNNYLPKKNLGKI